VVRQDQEARAKNRHESFVRYMGIGSLDDPACVPLDGQGCAYDQWSSAICGLPCEAISTRLAKIVAEPAMVGMLTW
jgi:hypothetical protein